MSEFIGSRISLISKSDIRYVGTLHQINSEDSTVALEQVKSFGTEGRRGDPDQEIAGSDSVYEYIVFRGSDVKDLRIEEPAAPKENNPPPMPDDPAILGSGARPQNQPPQQQGFPPGGPSPSFQQRPPMPPPYQQYNQFPNQRFPGPGGPPPQGYPGYPGPPYGHPPPGYFPPGQGFQGPPGQFPPQQQMQFPPGVSPQQRGPPQQSPQQQDLKPSGITGSAEAPVASLQPQQSSGTPNPASQGVTPDPPARTGQAPPPPPPPVESKPDVATALGAPSTDQPMAVKTAPTAVKGGKITPVIPLASQASRAPAAQAPPVQANVPNPPGQAAADAAISYQNAAQAASAAVANAMAKLPPAPGQKPKEGGAVDNLTQKVNQMRVDDRMRKQSGSVSGSSTGHRGGRGGRGRGGRDQNRGIAVPTTDFDFETANAQFNKEDLVKEAAPTAESPAEGDSSTPMNGDAATTADGAAEVVIPAAAASNTASVYSKSSFFDNISSEARDREEGQDGRRKPGGPEFRSEERKRNMETFGLGSVDGGYRGGYRGRGRGRGRGGGYRGGPRGGFRGGRGAASSTGGVAEA